MKPTGSLFFVLLVLLGTAPLPAETIRFVTVNVWSGLDYKGTLKMGEYESAAQREGRTRLLAEQLDELHADVVGCNEANKLPGYVRHLSGELHDDYFYHVGLGGLRIGPVGLPVNLREGDAIMAKAEWHLKKVSRRQLTGGPVGNFFTFHFSDATQVIAGRITIRGCPLYVFDTHWQSEPRNPAVSLAEARKTIKFVDQVAHGQPLVLLGDLNAPPDAPAVRMLGQAGFIDACVAAGTDPGATWDEVLNRNIQQYYFSGADQQKAERVCKRIDYILVRGKELKVLQAGLVLNKPVQGRHVSDHFGLMAEIEFSPGP